MEKMLFMQGFFLMFNNLKLIFFVPEKERACMEITCSTIIISTELISWFLMEQTVFFPCLSFPLLSFVCSEQTVNSLMQGLSSSTAFFTFSSGPGFYITTVQTLIISAFFFFFLQPTVKLDNTIEN